METNNILLRKATLDDLSILQHWDQQPQVIAAAPNDEIEWVDLQGFGNLGGLFELEI